MSVLRGWLCIFVIMMWPGLVSGEINGPDNITVKETVTALLTCSSLSGEAISFGTWTDDAGTITSGEMQIKTTGKYSNFELLADYANGQYNLRINNAEYEDQGMYSCQIGAEPAKSAMLTVEAQVTSVTLTVNGASGSSVDVMADEEQTLVCTAYGARPRVGIDWTNNGVIVSGDTETESIIGDTTDTTSTLLYTPSRNYNGHEFQCVTTGQQAATPQSQAVTLNVQFAPVDVNVEYSQGTIICSSVANPTVADNQYVIFLTGKTLSYDPESHGCTAVKCTATNDIGTGLESPAEYLCPSIPTTNVAVSTPRPNSDQEIPTTSVEVCTSSLTSVPSCVCASTGIGAIIGALLGGIVIAAVAVILIGVFLLRRNRHRDETRLS